MSETPAGRPSQEEIEDALSNVIDPELARRLIDVEPSLTAADVTALLG